MAECLLPKQDVAGSNPVSRSSPSLSAPAPWERRDGPDYAVGTAVSFRRGTTFPAAPDAVARAAAESPTASQICALIV